MHLPFLGQRQVQGTYEVPRTHHVLRCVAPGLNVTTIYPGSRSDAPDLLLVVIATEAIRIDLEDCLSSPSAQIASPLRGSQ